MPHRMGYGIALRIGRDDGYMRQDNAVIQKVVKKYHLQADATARADLDYWLSKSPAERVAAVDDLRRQYYGNAARLQRVARVIQRPPR